MGRQAETPGTLPSVLQLVPETSAPEDSQHHIRHPGSPVGQGRSYCPYSQLWKLA